MTRYRRLLIALLAALPATPVAAQQAPKLLPAPAEIHAASGSFAISAKTPIVIAANDLGAQRAAEEFAAFVKATRGLSLKIRTGRVAGPAIRFVRTAEGKPESYTLRVSDDGARIAASSDAGLLYGGVSLWQAMTQAPGEGRVTVSGFETQDAPRFQWRGLMLDSARHFQSPDYVRKLIDWMAANKLNTLHWHLVDDQGWRIQIKKYPRLTSISGWRLPATAPGAPPLPPVGGYYSQDEIRAIVAYAAARSITIIPEIEMPGHALAAIRAYPWLGTGAPIPPGTESDWGVFPWLYNTDDRTFAFLQDVLTEVMALFPSRYIHVGGDEAVKTQWKASPAIQAKIKALGLKDKTALQAWFVHRIGEFLQKNGRRLIGWDEILDGDVPPDATITSWRGIEGAIKAAKSGHDAVLSPAPTLYLNNRQGFSDLEPPGHGGLVDLATVYGFDPVPAEIPADARHHVLGLQANLWTEHVRTEARASWMYFPRASAVAELGWSPASTHSYPDFVRRVVPQMERMQGLGLEPAATAFAVQPKITWRAGSDTALVALASPSGLEIRYSSDGRPVTATSPVYVGPLTVSLPREIRAATFLDGRKLPGALDRRLDAVSLRRRSDEELRTCTEKVRLALEDDYPVKDRAVMVTDIMNPCWLYEDAPVGGAKQIAISVGQLPFNFQIGDDIDKIHFPRPESPAGEFEVFAGKCEGPRIAVLPLAPAVDRPGITRLTAPILPRAGNETLCIRYTARGVEPMWAVNEVELIP